jgi:hypothetical protein
MWRYASAAHQSFARTRKKAPNLARAGFSLGRLHLFSRGTKWHVWDAESGFWWAPFWSEASAREVMAERERERMNR